MGNSGSIATIHGLGNLDNWPLFIRRNDKPSLQLSEYNTYVGNGITMASNGATVSNVGFGSDALKKLSRSSYHTAFGSEALYNSGSDKQYGGEYCVAIGRSALYSNLNGEYNTAAGVYALANTLDSFNTAVGYNAGIQNITGTKNVAIGANTSVGTNLQYAVALGADASVTTSNSVVLGGTGAAAVKVGIGVSAPTADLDIRQHPGDTAGIQFKPRGIKYNWRMFVDGTGNLNFAIDTVLAPNNRVSLVKGYINGTTGAYVDVSDARLKKNIEPMNALLQKTMQLKPKTYRFKDGGPNAPLTYGFLAQDLERQFPDMVQTNPQTGMKALPYQDFGVIAVQTIKEQQALLQQLDALIEELNNRLARLEGNRRN
jgi:hypothetical protein